ncbi:hypothetical protein [Agrococcus citreus]|uniref:hypothetical protein n=1 Tax=Agrococcus citreus TaxID=84643 RepID=UPI0031DE15EB
MIRRRSRAAAVLVLAAVVLGATACGPAGELAPTPPPSAAPTPTATEPTTPSPTPTPTSTPTVEPTPTPADPVSPPAAPRTPPGVPPLPEPSIEATEVPAAGPEPVLGARYDYLIPCDPRIPMWFDDGDGRRSWQSNDRGIECEEGQVAVIAMSVRFEEARLLTLYEDDIGMPSVFRAPTLTGFGADAIAAVAEQSGLQEVDIEIWCQTEFVGYVNVGGRYAYCPDTYGSVRLTDVPLADALASVGIGSPDERQMALYAS